MAFEEDPLLSFETVKVPQALFLRDGINDAPAMIAATADVAFGRWPRLAKARRLTSKIT